MCPINYLDLVGEHSAPKYLLFGAVYWSLARRGYFGVSNVAPVETDNAQRSPPEIAYCEEPVSSGLWTY